jgi:hypothetical protein
LILLFIKSIESIAVAISSEANKASLRGPEDWEEWEHQFKSQAVAFDLWDQITGDEPLIRKPRMPEIAGYQQQAQTRGGAGRGRAGNAGRSQTVDDDDSSDPSVAQLTDQSRNAYQLDMQRYIQSQREYKEQSTAVQKLKKWVIDTVASHYTRVACEPTEALSQWYTQLKSHVGISDVKSQTIAREQYKEAVKSLTKPKDWQSWLKNWEKAMILAQQKKVPEAMSSSSWTTDFFGAVAPIAEQWMISYRITKQEQIEKSILSFRVLANDFREYMGMRFSPGRSPRVAKGAFGPTYAGQDTPDQSASGDAQLNSAEVASARRRRGPSRKRSAPEEEEDPSGRLCEACDQSHALAVCFYVFPERAPNWFKENPEIRALVDEQLKENPSLKEQIQRLKAKRSRSNLRVSIPRRSQSNASRRSQSNTPKGSQPGTPRESRSNTPRGVRESQPADE